jgi:hypothetical protein
MTLNMFPLGIMGKKWKRGEIIWKMKHPQVQAFCFSKHLWKIFRVRRPSGSSFSDYLKRTGGFAKKNQKFIKGYLTSS